MNTAPSASQSAESSSTKQNPATTINNSGPLDPSWNRVYTLSEDGPATSTEPDAEWECETEEELVTLDLSGFGSRLVRSGVECALINVDSPSPHLRIGDHIFRGHWTEPIGSDIHLNVEKGQSIPSTTSATRRVSNSSGFAFAEHLSTTPRLPTGSTPIQTI
ncbi:hypothetical protein CF327_g920 [Tilletia walkeri]|nr:hypothetical protein CF327_g920 [Tilletia walkeri]